MAARDLPPLPLPQHQWVRIAATLALPPQQTRIVELILRRQCDKQIAAAMNLGLPTISTYKKRVFAKLGVSDRIELVLRIFALSHQMKPVHVHDMPKDDIREKG